MGPGMYLKAQASAWQVQSHYFDPQYPKKQKKTKKMEDFSVSGPNTTFSKDF